MIAVGVPTVGSTLTVRVTIADGPLHPDAVTWIFTAPAKPLAQVITPVAGSIVPAEPLLKDQVNPVPPAAVVA
jgi:hypothetical protein